MPISINTNDPQYRQFLNALPAFRVMMGPRIKALLKLPKTKQRQWLQRDPLMNETVRLAMALIELVQSYMEPEP